MADKPNCTAKLKESLQLSDFEAKELEQLEDIIHDLMDYHTKTLKDGTVKVDRGAMQKSFEKVLKDWQIDSRTRAAQAVANIIKQKRLENHLIDPTNFAKTSLDILNLFEGNNSIETYYRTGSNRYSSMFHSRLKEEGITKEFFRGELDEMIFEQAYNAANKKPDVSDPRAVKAYNIIKEMNNAIWQDMRVAGLNLRYRKDFLISRNYNAERMMNIVDGDVAASKEAWIDDMLENFVDSDATFSEASKTKYDSITGKVVKKGKEREILSQMYDDIVASQLPKPVRKESAKNYLNRLKGRKIEFKNGKAEYQFMLKYGNSDKLMEGIQYGIDRSAKTVANVTMLGTNSAKTYQNLIQKYAKAFQGQVTKGQLDRQLSKINKAYHEVVEPPHAPSTLLEKGVNFMRGLAAFSKLGSSLFSALWDANSTAAMFYVRTGESQIKGYVDAWFQNAKFLMSPEKLREMGDALNANIWFNDMAIAMGGHKGDYDTGYDHVNKIFNYAGKATGVPYQTKISRVVNAVLQAKAFQKMLDNLDNLNKFQKLALDEYKISMDDLKFIKQYGTKHDSLGSVTPSSIWDIPLDKFDKKRGVAMKKQRDLFYKFANYIDDAVQKGTPTPTAKAKRHLFKSRTDNELRVLASLVMQFKETAWQVLLANKENFMKSYEVGGVATASRFVGEYAMLGLVSYMGIEYLKAKLFNKDDPFEKFARGGDDAKAVFLDYVNKASFVPVLSDAATAATSPYPVSNLTTYLAGPSMAAASELMKIPVAKDQAKAGAKWVRRNALPMNHLGIKALERHLFNYEFLTGDRLRK